MANQFLKLRRSSVPGKIPDTGSLDYGEIALNTYDGLAFMKKSGSNGEEIVTIGSKSGAFTGSFTGSFIGSLQGTSSWATNTLTASSADNFLVRGTLTAQTLVVQVITSSTELITGSLIVSGALNVYSGITGSFSGSLSNLKGTPTHIPYFSSSQVLADSTMFQVDNGSGAYSIAINQNGVSGLAPEALFVYQPSTSSYNLISGKGNLNNYLQINIQNENNGANASSDIVATANNGNEFTNYIDMGINGASFTGFLGGPNDAYIYATGSNFHIGNINPNTHLGFFVGGNDVTADNKFQLNPNNQHEMTGSLNISGSLIVLNGITGSLFGTASWALNALTASYVSASNIAGLNLSRIVTGSITASVNITPENLFLIKSGSNVYFNISSSSDAEIYSNKFEIKNFNTKQSVLTVSQSIVQFATQSSDPVGSTNVGSIWFTSTAMYVGLD